MTKFKVGDIVQIINQEQLSATSIEARMANWGQVITAVQGVINGQQIYSVYGVPYAESFLRGPLKSSYRHYNFKTGEFSKEFQQYFDDIAQYDCDNYDCNQAADCIYDGLTACQAAELLQKEHLENVADSDVEDWEDRLNRDTSMNG